MLSKFSLERRSGPDVDSVHKPWWAVRRSRGNHRLRAGHANSWRSKHSDMKWFFGIISAVFVAVAATWLTGFLIHVRLATWRITPMVAPSAG